MKTPLQSLFIICTFLKTTGYSGNNNFLQLHSHYCSKECWFLFELEKKVELKQQL